MEKPDHDKFTSAAQAVIASATCLSFQLLPPLITGFANPTGNDPYILKPVSCVSAWMRTFPTVISGNIRMLASPLRGESGHFLCADFGFVAASNWISPSMTRSFLVFRTRSRAERILSSDGCSPDPWVEYERSPILGII